MALTYGFYNSYAGDRKYDAMQISEMFDGILADGIVPSQGQLFAVTAGGGMTINVGTGRAWFFHSWTKNDSVMMLTVPASDVSRPRIDAVVLEVNRDQEVRANSIKIVSGEAAVNPVKPTLVTTDKVHQYPLAYITVGAGVEEIKAENIENAVGLTPTPFATGVLETTPLDELWSQWEGEWDTWFANIKLQLSGDIVTNLQGQIDALKEKHEEDIEYLVRYVDVSHVWTKTADYTSPGTHVHTCKGSGAIAIIIGAGGGGGGGGGAAADGQGGYGTGGGGGGGGGGGNIVVTMEQQIIRGKKINIVVGARGEGGIKGTGVASKDSNLQRAGTGGNGGASSVFGIIAEGGSGGAGGGSGGATYSGSSGAGGGTVTSGGYGGKVRYTDGSESYKGANGADGAVVISKTYSEIAYTTYNGAAGGGGGAFRSPLAVAGGNGGTGLSGANGGKGGNGASSGDHTSENYPTNGSLASGYGNGGGGGGGAGALYAAGQTGYILSSGANGGSGTSGRVIIYERGVVD